MGRQGEGEDNNNKGFGNRDEWNIVLLGKPGVGKAAIAFRYISNYFDIGHEPSARDTYRKVIGINDHNHLLDILDPAGGYETYEYMKNLLIGQGDLFALVFALDSISGFDEIPSRLEQIRKIKEGLPHMITLVGNKNDLEDEREVPREQAERYAESEGIPYMEISAKTGNGIHELFHDLVTYGINGEYPHPKRNVKSAKKNNFV